MGRGGLRVSLVQGGVMGDAASGRNCAAILEKRLGYMREFWR